MKAFAFAKINRSLKIGKIQKNGLHEIKSEMQKISLYDEISIELLSDAKDEHITMEMENNTPDEMKIDEHNTIIRAIRLFFKKKKPPALRLVLKKNIPLGAGLGGGSTDAAITLAILQKMFGGEKKELLQMGFAIGSDVPFFLLDAARAMVSGTGEKIALLPALPAQHLLLLRPQNTHISSVEAYKIFDHSRKKSHTQNDFATMIFERHPDVAECAEFLKTNGAKEVDLCGSGACVFGVFENEEEIKRAQKKANKRKWWKWSGETKSE